MDCLYFRYLSFLSVSLRWMGFECSCKTFGRDKLTLFLKENESDMIRINITNEITTVFWWIQFSSVLNVLCFVICFLYFSLFAISSDTRLRIYKRKKNCWQMEILSGLEFCCYVAYNMIFSRIYESDSVIYTRILILNSLNLWRGKIVKQP